MTAFTSLIICINFIPKSAIKDNLIESSKFLHSEGIYKNYTNNINFRLDNFTDNIMLNIVASVDTEHPIDAAMKSYYHIDRPVEGGSLALYVEKIANDDYNEMYSVVYGRY